MGNGGADRARAVLRKGRGVGADVAIGSAVNGAVDPAASHEGDKCLRQAKLNLEEAPASRTPKVGVPARRRKVSSAEEGRKAVTQTILAERCRRHSGGQARPRQLPKERAGSGRVAGQEPFRRVLVDVKLEEIAIGGDETQVGEFARQMRSEKEERRNRRAGAGLAENYRQDGTGRLDGKVGEAALAEFGPARLEANAGRKEGAGQANFAGWRRTRHYVEEGEKVGVFQ